MIKDGILHVENVQASYYKKEILHGVSLSILKGEIVSIIGPNGAGKSTLLKVITGLLIPSQGEVIFKGEKITSLRSYLRARRGISYFIQGGEVFPNLSLEENLQIGAHDVSKEEQRRRIEMVFGIFPDFSKMHSKRAGLLSGGQRQALALGIILMRKPELLLLDEPSAGLAPNLVKDIIGKIGDIRQTLETSILIVEQNIREALKICDRVYLLKNGLITGETTPRNISTETELERIFFS